MKKIILMMILFLLSFSYGFGDKPIEVSGEKIYLSSDIIKNQTTRVNFTITDLVIDTKGEGIKEKAFFELFNDIKSVNHFIRVENAKLNSPENVIDSSGRVWFKDKDGKLLDKIELNISGTFIFDWNKYKKNDEGNNILKFGNIKWGENSGSRPLVLNLKKDIEKSIISKIQLQVIRDLHLGFGVAGEIFDSEAGKGQSVNAHPAEISIKCDTNNINKDKPEIELTIPKKVTIRNENGKTKNVYLRFRSKISGGSFGEIENDDNECEIEFTPTKENITIFIDGNMKTLEEDENGVYTGTFVLRAEYDKD